jgi:hypothetical protein
MSATQTTRKALYVFDSGIPDLQKLLAGLGADQRVAILDSGSDGVLQLADALSGESGLDAIHLFSHGSAGSLWLGSTVLYQANLSGYSAALAQIGSALSDSGDLLLYGCNVAQGDSGQAFIEQLAAATGADVAASTNLTGATALGGDWVLEANTSSIETTTITQEKPSFPLPWRLPFAIPPIAESAKSIAHNGMKNWGYHLKPISPRVSHSSAAPSRPKTWPVRRPQFQSRDLGWIWPLTRRALQACKWRVLQEAQHSLKILNH